MAIMEEFDLGDIVVLPQTFTVARQITAINTATNQITVTGHLWVVNNQVEFENSGGAVPAGAALLTTYYVKAVVSSDVVELSATEGGAILDLTDSGSGINYLRGPGDPTSLTLKIRKRGQATLTYHWPTPLEVTRLSLSNFQYSTTADVWGIWRGKWQGVGGAAGAETFAIYIRPDVF